MLTRAFPAPLDALFAWRPGDAVATLDGRRVDDILDLYYYAPEDGTTTLGIQRADGNTVDLSIDPGDIDIVTSCFAPMEFKTCACDCVFCFIDQNPKGMREAIYVKDEDYRFSFLYGNYITLTSLGKAGIRRIIEQHMTPLYVSVHATDIDVRTRMLGIRKRIDVLEILRQLVAAGIEIHTQVVLCPGWNDGTILEKTFRELLELAAPAEDDADTFQAVSQRGFGYEAQSTAAEDDGTPGGVRSLAVVPVGLSSHREGLTQLEPVRPDQAARIIAQAAAWQDEARRRLGYGFIYLSDEFYLLADAPFPSTTSYDGFWQIDNAIGLTPRLRDTWRDELEEGAGPDDLPTVPLTVLTGELAAKAWRREFTPVLQRPGVPSVDVVGVPNGFYGHAVTVAGLLSGADLRTALLNLPPQPIRQIVLSPRVLNADGLTLDGLTLANIADGQPHRVCIGEEDGFIDFWRELG